jgi:hypothetical protein
MPGTVAVSNDNPRAGCILRKALMVVGIVEFTRRPWPGET